ncbi:MAG: hypothetical protein ACNA7W_10175 [Pseudomonadales bacterium]
MVRATTRLLLALGLSLSVQAAAQIGADRYPEASRSGIIEALDFGGSNLIVSGYRYYVGVDTRVEIGGSYGAFTMLEPGMQIVFDYLVISPSERRMVRIQELPAHVKVEET